jgi:hypothetical protein
VKTPRVKAVSKSSLPGEDLNAVWQPHSGRFDDGIEAIHPPEGAPIERIGPDMRALMKKLGVTEENLKKNLCFKCGKELEVRGSYCLECRPQRRGL